MFLINIYKKIQISCENIEEENVIDGEFNLISKENTIYDVLKENIEYKGLFFIDSKIENSYASYYFAYIIFEKFVFSVILNKPMLKENLFNNIYKNSLCFCNLDIDEHTIFDHLDCEKSSEKEKEFFYKNSKKKHHFLKKYKTKLQLFPIKFKRNNKYIYCKISQTNFNKKAL